MDNVKIGLWVVLVLVSMLIGSSVYARQGCCSRHGGVAGCNTLTRMLSCQDGTDSPSCMCEIPLLQEKKKVQKGKEMFTAYPAGTDFLLK